MTMHFDTYVAKHSESVAHDIVEGWERHMKIKHQVVMSLEDRWNYFIRETDKYLTTETGAYAAGMA